MKLSHIKQLFENKMSFKTFFEIIKNEIASYDHLLNKKGSSIPINLDEDIGRLVVTSADIKNRAGIR